ncbi:LOW QUALITY PROTEIN: platelet endothelial cell adhesion molecule-like, partial [Gastrophryne carolinensis]
TEVTEGDDIIVRCQAPEEEPPMKFGFYKFLGQVKEGPKLRTSALNFAEATFKIKEGEDFLHFECDVELVSVIEPKSGFSKRQTVTVVAPFGTPTITVRPSNNITEGTKMEVTCTVRTSHIVPQDVTLTLQKGSHILNSATTGTLTHSQVASETDTGNYTCKVEGTKASKSNSALIKVQGKNIYLYAVFVLRAHDLGKYLQTLKELFPKPVLAIRRTINAPYIMEDEQLLLECSVSSLLQEEAQKQEFYLNHITRRQREKGGRFHMKVRGSDSGLYNCEVTIANITKRSNPVSLTVYAPVSKPILQHVVERKKMVVLGDTLTLTCRSPTGTPPISYTLYQGSQQLGTVEVNNYSEATFRVNVSKQHDSGQYQCHARNRNSKASLFSDVVNITAIVPVADVKLIIIPSNGEVEEGAELSLVCNTWTLPINFQFYVKKDIDIMLLNVTETEQLHAKYQVQSFTKQKEGNYFCTASNQANKSDHSKVKEVKAVLASWKKAVIGAFVFLIIVAAIGIIVYLYLDKKKKGKNISTDTSRTTKIVSSTNESAAVEMKGDDVYFGKLPDF